MKHANAGVNTIHQFETLEEYLQELYYAQADKLSG